MVLNKARRVDGVLLGNSPCFVSILARTCVLTVWVELTNHVLEAVMYFGEGYQICNFMFLYFIVFTVCTFSEPFL